MKPIPFFRLFASLALGIGCSLFIPFSAKFMYATQISGCISLIISILLFYFFPNVKSKLIAGALFLIAQLCIGINLAHFTQYANYKSFFANNKYLENAQYVQLKIDDAIRLKQNSQRTIAVLEKFYYNKKWFNCSGNILVYWPSKRNKQSVNYNQGTVLIAKNAVMDMPKAAFPYDFDFKAVMRYRNVQHQIFLDSTNFFVQDYHKPKGLIELSLNCRNYLIDKLNYSLPPQVSGLAQSIVLGFKDNLDPSDSKAFAISGTMHILAVSGLHVGMIYLILTTLFTFYTKNKRLSIWQSLTIIILLWIYTFITGIGPSVIRASIMFSILEIGRSLFNKTGNGINNLFAAAYIQLLIFPLNIIEVGFQLSYLAVLGIMYFYPKIVSLYGSKYWLPNKIYQMACISIAATIGTLPVSIYFFHSFPVWFIFSNLLLVPLGMIMLSALIAHLVLLHIPIIGTISAAIITLGLKLMQGTVHLFSQLPFALIEDLYITEIEVAVMLVIIPLITHLLYYKTKRNVAIILSILTVYIVYYQINYHRSHNQKILVCAELRNTPLISIVNNNSLLNLSQPLPKSFADSLFQFQKGFIQTYHIQKSKWQILTKAMEINFHDIHINHLKNQTTKIQFPNRKPIIFHWKARKNADSSANNIHIIQNRNLRWAHQTVNYQVLKNSYILYKY